MKRIPALLIVGVIVAMLGARPARSQSEGDATAAPSPANTDSTPPATAPPATSPGSERELTAVFVSGSPDAIVLRKWDSTEISFHVGAPGLMPKNLRAGDVVTIVYNGSPGAAPEAVRITALGGGKQGSAGTKPAAPGSPERPSPAPETPKRAPSPAATPPPAPAAVPAPTPAPAAPPAATPSPAPSSATPAPSTSSPEKTSPSAGGTDERPPVLPEQGGDASASTPPPSTAESTPPPASGGYASGSSAGPVVKIVLMVAVGVLLVGGIFFGVLYSKKRDRVEATSLKLH